MDQGLLGFTRKIRIKFLNCCKCEFYLLVCVKQISKFSDNLEITLIGLKATENLLADTYINPFNNNSSTNIL
jgi:hypothetical protein